MIQWMHIAPLPWNQASGSLFLAILSVRTQVLLWDTKQSHWFCATRCSNHQKMWTATRSAEGIREGSGAGSEPRSNHGFREGSGADPGRVLDGTVPERIAPCFTKLHRIASENNNSNKNSNNMRKIKKQEWRKKGKGRKEGMKGGRKEGREGGKEGGKGRKGRREGKEGRTEGRKGGR